MVFESNNFSLQKINSDPAGCQSKISTRSLDLVTEYHKLKQGLQKVLAYLEQKGINRNDIVELRGPSRELPGEFTIA
jgi:hypothetical protein